MLAERECRHIVQRIRNSRLPADLGGFHIQSAVTAAELCRLTYLVFPEPDYDPAHDHIPIDEPFGTGAGAGVSFEQILGLVDVEGQASFAIDTYFVKVLGVRIRDHIFIAVRGTKGLRDWLTNLQITTETLVIHSIEGGTEQKLQVHSGFLKLMNQIRRGIVREVAKLADDIQNARSDPIPQIVACGHSLGGALALLFSARFNDSSTHHDEPFYRRRSFVNVERHQLGLGNDGIRVDSIYSFGAPKSGKQLYSATLNLNHHRLVMEGDLVPGLPGTAIGFEHDTDALVLSPQGPRGILVKQHEDTLRPIKKSLFSRRAIQNIFDNHSIDKYLRSLNALAN
jgi:Lipase (class 3)